MERTGRPAAASGVFRLGGDLPVVRLGFGAMRITGPGIWGEPADRDEAVRVLRRAVELGVNLIDTADAYGPYVSEDLIAEALHPYPAELVIATKGGFTRQGPGAWAPVGRPEYLRQCVEMSLRRLKLERIDLYQLHRIDPQVTLEDQLGELAAMRQEGKIRHIGLSEVSVAEIRRARELTEIVSVQNRHNLTDRRSQDVVDYCTAEGLGFIPWHPLAVGELARPGGMLDAAAKEHGVTPSRLALAWLLHESPVQLPIPGTSKVAHLEDNLAAAAIELTAEEVAALTALD
jgi:pyridoxine 4-dehydrogenase